MTNIKYEDKIYMGIYYFITFLIILTSIFQKKIQAKISMLILFLVLCLRDESVGNDLIPYITLFKKIGSINIRSYHMEKGYLLLNKIIYYISSNPRVFIIIYSIIICIMINKYIRTNSNIIWLSYFLFITFGYYEMTFNTIRQFLAMGICWLSLEKIKKREILKFFIYYGIAISFHQTAIFFIILYLIYPLKINFKYYIYIILGILFNLTILPKFLSMLLKYFPKYNARYSETLLQTGGGLKFLCVLIIILVCTLLLKRTKKLNIYYHMLSIAVVLQSVAYNFSIFTRIVNYFSIAVIILIPELLLNKKISKIKDIVLIIIIVLSYIYYRILLELNYSGVVPYRFFIGEIYEKNMFF